ncbi:acyl-CoA dehydrogenase family protein [Actinokineospora globicatena]|uniref:acyl-CoA dehydrogenase family protein n=1 Tax=Actinokineospora globicatena TaxID=103729 RepID=UPI0020A4141C|nr:acyl-CoA dehydrogenase family protein [Actinokineospora globicatena]MCP2303909.1 acyl-CoA dehydrogenase [Actinokineospora globicatena]GLW78931.1 acyl-CoA dehydrogenase [Actinokineospora globicatena]GLW86657.1 acyl-CoA dehydrogenase [Actinokineospora globicatena]
MSAVPWRAALVDRVLPVVAEHAAVVDTEAAFPAQGMAELAASGLHGLLVPAEFGGLGGGLHDLVGTAQDLAGACLSTAMVWGMHCQQVDTLVQHATGSLRDDVLPRIARGELYLASVTTEPGKGGHLLTAVAALRDDGDALLVDRDAPVVTGGLHADGFLITMREAEDAGSQRVTLVYADRDQLAVERSGGWDTVGMRGTESVGLRIAGRVPAGQVVGQPGGFREIALRSMAPVGHLVWSACWLGAARAALADLVGWLRSSERGKGVDVRSELTAERVARVRMDLEVVSAYLSRVTDEVVASRAGGASLSGVDAQIHLNTLKVVAAESTFRAVDRMVRIAGLTAGYRKDSPLRLERRFRDLRSASLNYADDRLLVSTGALTLMDRAVRLL